MDFINDNQGFWSNGFQLGVTMERLPRYVYKYRPPNTYTNNIIADCQLWLSNPSQFNDPFDCQIIPVSNDVTLSEIKNYLKLCVPDSEDEVVQAVAEHMLSNPLELEALVNNSIRETIINKVGVSCFARKPDNILMWSHYAEAHTGLCLKYDILSDEDFFTSMLPVIYDSVYPQYNFLHSVKEDYFQASEDLIFKGLLTKSSLWSYEEEWRVIKIGQGASGAHSFKKQSLTEVLFGCKASSKFIDEIREVAYKSGLSHLTFKKAQVSRTKFELMFEPLL
jgi:hypothetical protein